MEAIDDKIKAIIQYFNLNNFSFSKRIGVTGTTVDSIVNGRPQADGTRKKTKPGMMCSLLLSMSLISTQIICLEKVMRC